MSRPAQLNHASEHRKYFRLNSVLPVDFAIHSGRTPHAQRWHQGYTCNVSNGGLCLETVGLDETTLHSLERKEASLDLQVHIPLGRPPVKAVTRVAWVEKENDRTVPRFLIGLEFEVIEESEVKRILGQARWMKFSSQTAVAASVVLFVAFLATTFYSFQLRQKNEKMVEQLVQLQQEEIRFTEDLEQAAGEKQEILQQLETAVDEGTERAELENTYAKIVAREERIADHLAILEREKKGLQETILDKMYLWLENHQNPLTGLVLSFEGDVGVVKDWSFTYDQALAAIVFAHSGREHKARKILNFYNQLMEEDFQGYYNAYYYDSGEPSEFVVHTGPNTWLGIAILHYTRQTRDGYYIPVARKIADWLISYQERDPAGGIKGGPDVSWFATEHNLDAYAFFHTLYDLTGDEKYDIAQRKTLSWLKTYSLIPHGRDYQAPPINRGRGDSTIATDTFAWALAAVSPEQLVLLSMDPEQIMDFAEEHCGVTTQYQRPSGAVVEVKGFDFAKHAHMPRGGMVSPEWSAQMIVSYQILARHFAEKGDTVKAGFYEEKANAYIQELNKLIISSSSPKGQGEGCLPYATLEDSDTGHGWTTPHGNNTCSISGTAYMIMAINKWNPLTLD